MLERWAKIDLYDKLRETAKGRATFVLHDGPPYANGNIHIGHALNKILKDLVTRSQQMLGHRFQLRAGLGLPRPPDRVEDRGGVQGQGQGQAEPQGPGGDDGVPRRMPRLRRALAQRAARGVQAARRRGRLGRIPTDDGVPGRGADRPRDHEVRRDRPALSRLEAGDVVRGREDRARRGRGRVPGLSERHGVGEVSGDAVGIGTGRRADASTAG